MNKELKDSEYTQALGYMAPYMKSWQIGDQPVVENALKDAITKVIGQDRESLSTLEDAQEEINIKLAESNK